MRLAVPVPLSQPHVPVSHTQDTPVAQPGYIGQQPLCVVVLEVRQHCFHRSLLDQFAVMHNQNVVAQIVRLAQIVGDEQVGRTVICLMMDWMSVIGSHS